MFHGYDDWRRLTRNRSIDAAYKPLVSDLHMIAQARFWAFAALLLPENSFADGWCRILDSRYFTQTWSSSNPDCGLYS